MPLNPSRGGCNVLALLLLTLPVAGQYLHSSAIALPAYAQGLTDFPYLISCNSTVQSCPQLRTVSNGGQVQNSSGFDIAFYADAGLTTKLNWETEDWSATTGNGDWWVQIPASTNTIYEAWDNSSITTDQSSKTATWSGENYQFVGHGGTPSSFSAADSSANNLTGSATSVTAATGIVNGAGAYNGSASFVSYTNPTATQCSPACTLEAWIKTTTVPASGSCILANQWHFGPSPSFGSEICFANNLATGNAHTAWGNSSGFEAANAMYPLADGNWHALAMTFSAGAVNFFVDGILRGSWLSQTVTISYSTQNLTIGCDSNSSPAGFFTGDIDEVRISSDAKAPAWEAAVYQNVANAELAAQPVKQQPLFMSTMYFGGNSCQSAGMTVGTSLDGIAWTSIFNLAQTNLQIPLFLQWNGYLWLAYTTSTNCGVSSGITLLNTPLPLTPASIFTFVANVAPTGFGTNYVFATNWFIGDDGVPNLILNSGTNVAASVYVEAPTDPVGLTAWSTTATQITFSGYYTDPQLIELNPSSYVLLVKDSATTTIGYFTSSTKLGTYTLQTNDFGFGTVYEAPHAVETSPGTWTLYLDEAGSSLHYVQTTSFPTGWGSVQQYSVYNCGQNSGNPTGYCFHPVPFVTSGPTGVR